MKAYLLNLAARIDALTLRERVMLFLGLAAGVVFIVYSTMLDPMLRNQKALRTYISQQHNNVAGMDAEITAKAQAYALDPDAPTRLRLEAVKREMDKQSADLMAMQKGLVAPEQIVPLVGQLLKANGHLRLVSMTTLPVSGLSEAIPAPVKTVPAPAPGNASAATAPAVVAATPAGVQPVAKPDELLYRHGVEISVEGNYLDMVDYMSALESMSTQLFWGQAKLEVGQYPTARLTLTLYTLSLDRKWMKL
ncbi:MAG: hypothetical protein V4463_02945 [Pseudomonadota bacterium]